MAIPMEIGKEIFNKQILEYSQNIFGVVFEEIIFLIPSVVLSLIITFFLSVIILVVLARKNFFRRRNKIWNLIAKLHYPIWMSVFIILGFIIGVINGVSSRAESILKETGKSIIEASIPILYEHLINELPLSSLNEKITIRSATTHIMKDMAYVSETDSKIEGLKAQSINWMTSTVGDWIITYAVNALVSKAMMDVGEALHFSDDDLEFSQVSLIDMDLTQSESSISQVVYEAIVISVKKIVLGAKKSVYSLFFLVMSLLLLEPVTYYYCRSKLSGAERK